MDDVIAAARAALGKGVQSHRWRVEEGQVRRFQEAIAVPGLEGPASETPTVPITYSVASSLWGVSHRELMRDLGMDLDRVVHGEQRFEIIEPLEVGGEYMVNHRVAEVNVKSGKRAGRMLFVGVETTVRDLDGRLRVRELHTSIQTER